VYSPYFLLFVTTEDERVMDQAVAGVIKLEISSDESNGISAPEVSLSLRCELPQYRDPTAPLTPLGYLLDGFLTLESEQ
jgi:hypothetical protein